MRYSDIGSLVHSHLEAGKLACACLHPVLCFPYAGVKVVTVEVLDILPSKLPSHALRIPCSRAGELGGANKGA